MRMPHHPGTTAAILLLGVAAFGAWFAAAPRWPAGAPLVPAPSTRTLSPLDSAARQAIQACQDHVTIIHDLYWASACAVVADEQRVKRQACVQPASLPPRAPADPECAPGLAPPDDSPDCTLPEARARVLNLARAEAEQQCEHEEAAAAPP